MFLRISLILVFWFLTGSEARAESASGFVLPNLKESSESKRIEEAKTWIRKRVSEAQVQTLDEPALRKLELLYFLESHLDTLQEVSFQCKNRQEELENSIERSLPRSASPKELESAHLKALQDLFIKLCPAKS